MPILAHARLSSIQRLISLLTLACLLAFLAFYHLPLGSGSSSATRYSSPARNATLGFGAIYVLTDDDTTWRVQGLRQAARLTDLHLTIPVQQHPSDDTITTYLAGDQRTAGLHDIRAVLNYMQLLENFLDSDYDTALFFEDDIDFDIHVKAQMDAISQAIRSELDTEADTEPMLDTYVKGWWDVLWLGHYGVDFTGGSYISTYVDSHALPWDYISSKYNNYYDLIRAESELQSRESPQQIVYGAAPIGTYAFALTQAAARRIITGLRKHRVQQFDVALHDDCKDLRQRCVAPIPALMHHHRVLGQQSVGEANSKTDNDLSWWRDQHKYTYNVQWSARCNSAQVGEKLGEKYRCMPGRYDDNE